MNCILTSGSDLSSFKRNSNSEGNIAELSKNMLHILFLTCDRAGQWISICSRVPIVSRHVPDWHNPALLLDQCLVRYSEQNRPETILARIDAFLHSKVLLLAEVHIL